MMDPFTAASIASLGISLGSSLFGESPQDAAEKAQRQNQRMIEERLAQIRLLFNRRGEFFADAFSEFAPQLAFGDTQNRLAANAGARAAQANIRRQLGPGGGVFAAALQAGSNTAAANNQNTLRALATTEALRAASRRIQNEAGFIAGSPFAFVTPPQVTNSQQRAGLFAQLGTSLGALGARQAPAQTPLSSTSGQQATDIFNRAHGGF